MKPIAISIIIPCYNGERLMRETLDCLQKQTIDNWEAVIVNDGSTDNSLAVANEYAARDPRYRVINQPNSGPATSRNVGIKNSRGKYILPLDADDLIAPAYAEKAIEHLESHPNTKVVYCQCRLFGAKDKLWKLPDYSWENIIWSNSIFSSCVYRRSDFDTTNGYNPDMKTIWEDWDFLLSLLKPEDDVYCIPEPLFFYRQHFSSRNCKALDAKIYDTYKIKLILNHPEIYATRAEKVREWLQERHFFSSQRKKFKLWIKHVIKC